jgi:LysM repeat protein
MIGRYGAGDARKAALGSRYDEVQGFIDHIYDATAYDLATEVLAGKYGNGDTRKIVLGSRYNEVQSIVNSRVSPRSADTTYYYTVQPGDTVSQIAIKMNVQWQEIARLNGLQPPYTIYVGQRLRIN